MTEAIPQQQSSSFVASLADLRGSLKWLVAAAGAVVAVIIAGTSLKDLAATSGGWLVTAVVSAAIAIAIVLALLWEAGRILTLPRPTLVDLSNIESRIQLGEISADPVNSWILARKSYLLGNATSITALDTDKQRRWTTALSGLDQNEQFVWRGVRHEASIDSAKRQVIRGEITAAIADNERRITTLEDAAHLAATELRYGRLMNRLFLPFAVVFIVAMIAFAFSTSSASDDGANSPAITGPVGVRVLITDAQAAELPASCVAPELEGIAIAGTLEQPTVILEPQAGCPGGTIQPRAGLIILPLPPN